MWGPYARTPATRCRFLMREGPTFRTELLRKHGQALLRSAAARHLLLVCVSRMRVSRACSFVRADTVGD